MKYRISFGILTLGMLVAIALWASPVDQNAKGLVVQEPSAYAEPALLDDPHLQAALLHLRTAKAQLEAARVDKGGHRAQALHLTDEAIAETVRGIEYSRVHP